MQNHCQKLEQDTGIEKYKPSGLFARMLWWGGVSQYLEPSGSLAYFLWGVVVYCFVFVGFQSFNAHFVRSRKERADNRTHTANQTTDVGLARTVHHKRPHIW
jgi:hypothetical protein